MLTWDGQHHGSVAAPNTHLDGHVHALYQNKADACPVKDADAWPALDVGFDGHDYHVWSLDEILVELRPKLAALDELKKSRGQFDPFRGRGAGAGYFTRRPGDQWGWIGLNKASRTSVGKRVGERLVALRGLAEARFKVRIQVARGGTNALVVEIRICLCFRRLKQPKSSLAALRKPSPPISRKSTPNSSQTVIRKSRRLRARSPSTSASGLEAEEIVDLWNVVFPEDRNVWYDEEAKTIHFNEEVVGYAD